MTAVLSPRSASSTAPAPQTSLPRRSGGAARAPWWALAIVLGGALVLADVGGAVVQAVAGSTVLALVPAVLLHAKVRWRAGRTERCLYTAGMLVSAIIVLGLLMNVALPLLGVQRPLDRVPLALASMTADLGLLLWRADRTPRPSWRWTGWATRPVRPAHGPAVLAGVAVGLACLGAVRLNNDAGSAVALLGIFVTGAALAWQLGRRRATTATDAAVVFLSATALLLGTSLRGWFLIGHDVQREYFVFELTRQAGRWDMGAFADAYNACLSVTILPAAITAMTGLGGLMVFKLVLQLVFAAMPVATYVYGRRLVGRRLGLVAALLTIAFPTFFTDMAFLVRQEIAFLFLALMLLAATEPDWTRRRRITAACLFGASVVLSHYSTTYLVVGTLLLASALRLGAVLWARARGRTDGDAVLGLAGGRHETVLLSAPVVLTLLVLTSLWTGPATNTGGHAADVVRSSVSALLDPGSASGATELGYSLFAPEDESPQQELDDYAATASETAADAREAGLLLPVTPTEARPRVLPDSVTALTPLGTAVEAAGVDPGTISSVLGTLVARVLQVLLLVGTAAAVLRARGTRRLSPELRLLSVASVAALGAQVLTPGLSADYGILRSFQQSLIIVAPVLVLGALVCLRPLGRRAVTGVAVLAVSLFAVLTGAVAHLLGGYPAQLHLANTGPYHDVYYTNAQEVAAVRWLADVRRDAPEAVVTTDELSLREVALQLGTYSRVDTQFFPSQVSRDAYVVVGPTTLKDGRASVVSGGDRLFYDYPLGLLDQHKDVVLDDGAARVYR